MAALRRLGDNNKNGAYFLSEDTSTFQFNGTLFYRGLCTSCISAQSQIPEEEA